MKKILVTGAGGFIGRHAVPGLVNAGFEVHAADLRPMPLSPGVFWHQVNLLDAKAVGELVAHVQPTHLLHFAWYAEHGKFWTSPLNLDWVAASVSLFKSFTESGGKRAVFAGSCAEYDWSHETLIEDETPSNPGTLYGVCKDAARRVVIAHGKQTDVQVAWGRIFFLYGPNEHPNRLVPSIVNPLLRGEPAVVRSGGHVRDLMHVEDVAAAFVQLAGADATGIVNVASGNPVTLGDVARAIARLAGREDLLDVADAPGTPSNPKVMRADVTKLRATGFVPAVELDAGLTRVIEFARAGTTIA